MQSVYTAPYCATYLALDFSSDRLDFLSFSSFSLLSFLSFSFFILAFFWLSGFLDGFFTFWWENHRIQSRPQSGYFGQHRM